MSTPADPLPHEAIMAGYFVACEFGIYEKRAFDLAERMYVAMIGAQKNVDCHTAGSDR